MIGLAINRILEILKRLPWKILKWPCLLMVILVRNCSNICIGNCILLSIWRASYSVASHFCQSSKCTASVKVGGLLTKRRFLVVQLLTASINCLISYISIMSASASIRTSLAKQSIDSLCSCTRWENFHSSLLLFQRVHNDPLNVDTPQ